MSRSRYLYHYYRSTTAPLQRLSLMSDEQWMDLEDGDSLEARRKVLRQRRDVEHWLRESADAVGVHREVDKPFYFCYGPSAWCMSRYARPPGSLPLTLKLPMVAVRMSHASFTLSDSFYSRMFDRCQEQWMIPYRKKFHGRVWPLRDLENVLHEHRWRSFGRARPGDPLWKLDQYVEVQLWYKIL